MKSITKMHVFSTSVTYPLDICAHSPCSSLVLNSEDLCTGFMVTVSIYLPIISLWGLPALVNLFLG